MTNTELTHQSGGGGGYQGSSGDIFSADEPAPSGSSNVAL